MPSEFGIKSISLYPLYNLPSSEYFLVNTRLINVMSGLCVGANISTPYRRQNDIFVGGTPLQADRHAYVLFTL